MVGEAYFQAHQGLLKQQLSVASTIVTSQLPVKKCHDYLSDGNPSVADAILDRLIGGAQCIEMDGDSMRGSN